MYSEIQKTEIFNEIINRITCGESVRSILKSKNNKPDFVTLLKWIDEDEIKFKQYARAKEESAHSDADYISNIAEMVLSGELDPNAARVAIDAYKWSSGKKNPKKYGDALKLEHDGSLEITVKPPQLNAD